MDTTKFFSVFAILVIAGLALGGCAGTWDQIAGFLPSGDDANDIAENEIGALAEFSTAAGPAPDLHPAALHIEELGHEVMSIMSDTSMPEEERAESFRGLLARDLDILLIARFAIGNHWRSATEEQRQAYLDVFSIFVVNTYSARLGGVKVDRFEVLGAQSVGENDILVRSKVDRTDSKPIKADWRVREREGRFLILDLAVEGISMAMTLRHEFASVLRSKGGVDNLIQTLAERT